jgi:hypothetical protein
VGSIALSVAGARARGADLRGAEAEHDRRPRRLDAGSRVALTAIRDFVRPNPTALDLIELTTFSARDHQTYQRAYREIFSGSEGTQG